MPAGRCYFLDEAPLRSLTFRFLKGLARISHHAGWATEGRGFSPALQKAGDKSGLGGISAWWEGRSAPLNVSPTGQEVGSRVAEFRRGNDTA